MIFFCLIISLRIAEDDCEECGNTDGYRIVEIGQNVHRTDSCQTGCQKHLNSVRNHSLHHTREGVEDTGCLAVVYAKLITYLLCDISYSQDCHRVVGCADIHQRYERSNGEFGSTLAVNTGGNLVDDIVDSSVFPDDFQHSACQHGDNHQLAHARDSIAHCREPAKQVVGEGRTEIVACHADEATEYRAHCQNSHHVHAGY